MPAPAIQILNTHLMTATTPVGPLLTPFRKSPIHVVLPTLVVVPYGQGKQLGSPSALNNLHFEPGPKYVLEYLEQPLPVQPLMLFRVIE